MKIEAGKRYVRGDGKITAPLSYEKLPSDTPYVWDEPDTGLSWTDDGRYLESEKGPFDLVSEYVEPAPTVYSLIDDKYTVAASDALAEVRRAKTMWPGNANSAHEQYAVLLEEVDELKAHVWTNQKRRDLAAMRKEAIQVAAMALRFAAECCDEVTGRK